MSCNRCHVSASSGFKTGFRYCTMWPTKGGLFSLFLPRLSIVRYVNQTCAIYTPFSLWWRAKRIRIYLSDSADVCLLAVWEKLWSGFERLRNYESSGVIRFICITRDANEEKTAIGANARPMVFPTKLNDRVCGRPFWPCFPGNVVGPRARSPILIGLNLNCDRLIQPGQSISRVYLTTFIFIPLRKKVFGICDCNWMLK